MGSMFIVVVPIREHEVILRQKEHNIRVLDTETVERDGAGRPLGVRLYGNGSQTDIHAPITSSGGRGSLNSMATNGTTSTASNEVDIYTAIADGIPARIVLSGDSMTILKAEEQGKLTKSGSTDGGTLTIMENIFLEKHLEECLIKFDIMSACWGQSVDGKYSQVSFNVRADKTEAIITSMQKVGIGTKYNSTLCVCAASIYYEPSTEIKKGTPETGSEGDSSGDKDKGQNSKWNQFVTSIKSRLTVAQVVQAVQANAIMTFDYIVLVIVAACIAGLGLVDNSAVNVVASMLVSPLMGPIMALTFGTVIRDSSLVKIGLVSEILGLFTCLVIGLLFGISLQGQAFRGPWADADKWPTDQMRGRSMVTSLWIGVMVAIPSGAGVALSILAGNSGSLVGVAISASLLPPAVNCGMFWGMAIMIAIQEKMAGGDPLIDCHNSLSKVYTINHESIYCKNEAKEYSIMGIVSFGLTALNIILIFLVGVVVLKIKEVAPHTTRKALDRFWKQDLKAAREYNQHGRHSGVVAGLIEDLNETGDKEAILKTIEGDRVFNNVNLRTRFSPAGNILNEVNGSKLDSQSSEDVTSSSGGGWFGSLWGSKSKAEVKPPLPDPEAQPKKKDNNRPKLL